MDDPFARKKAVDKKPVEEEPVPFEPIKETEDVSDEIDKVIGNKSESSKEDVKKLKLKKEEVEQRNKETDQKAKEANRQFMSDYREQNKIRRQEFKEKQKQDKAEAKQDKYNAKHGIIDTSKIKDVVIQRRGIDWTRAILYLSVLGIMGIIFFNQMISGVANGGLAILLWLFGMMCFFPLGLILGWLFLDPYMRCKIMRRLRHTNYGMIYFVHKGAKRLDVRIKNFDDDVIVHNTKLWLINNEGVHYIDVNGNAVLQANIDSDNVATLPSNVPCMFLDSETMIPLTFHSTPSKTSPQVAGATLLGYVNNQIAKNLFFKKQMTYFYIIVLAITGITLAVVLGMYNDMMELKELIPNLQNQISDLQTLLQNLNNPLPP